MKRMSWKVMVLTLGLSAAILFASCVVYGLLVPAGMHFSAALEKVLPGFRWLTLGSFILGVAETFLYGACAGLVLTIVYNWVARRVESPGGRNEDPAMNRRRSATKAAL